MGTGNIQIIRITGNGGIDGEAATKDEDDEI